MCFGTSLGRPGKLTRKPTVPAAPQYQALFPVAHSGPRQVFVTWVRQMVETVTLGKIAKDDEESMICVVRVTMRQEHSMSVYTSSSVCACASKHDILPRSTAHTGKCWRETTLPVVRATPRVTLLSHVQSCLFSLWARA